jgi:hypothetical protein
VNVNELIDVLLRLIADGHISLDTHVLVGTGERHEEPKRVVVKPYGAKYDTVLIA